MIKVLRPDIQPQIEADLSWMYKLAGWLPKLFKEGYRLRAVEVIREYEKTLRDELDLRTEMANAINCAIILRKARCFIYRKCTLNFVIAM